MSEFIEANELLLPLKGISSIYQFISNKFLGFVLKFYRKV